MNYANEKATIYELIFKQRNVLLDFFMIIFSVAFLAILSNIRIPLWPVPITMQTFGIFLIAFFFGSRKGFLTIVAYVLAGLVGFGVFSGWQSGSSAIFGPTGGYILGFLIMSLVIGFMIEKGHGRTWKSVLVCMIVGEGILYLFGITGLWIYMGNVSLFKVLSAGLFPFIIGDIVKVVSAAALFPYLWKGAEKITQ